MKPLFEIRNEYDESLQEFITASMELRQVASLALRLVEKDADPRKLIETLREPLDRLSKALDG